MNQCVYPCSVKSKTCQKITDVAEKLSRVGRNSVI